jgi:TRAP-type C4-dicarboxylate transport system permease small subunit
LKNLPARRPTSAIPRVLAFIPKIAVTALIVLAIINLLIGVILRYFVVAITDYLDLDPIPFTWVEEVGEMSLAWLTLIGAAIGVRQRAHFTLHVFVHRLPPQVRLWIDRVNYLLITGVGCLSAWYGYKLCLLNRTLATPGLQINLAWLYASAVVGGALIAIYGLSMIVAPANGLLQASSERASCSS